MKKLKKKKIELQIRKLELEIARLEYISKPQNVIEYKNY